MKTKILTILILTLFAFSFASPQTNYYFGKYIESKNFTGIILEDHISYKANMPFFGETELGANYQNYELYIRNILTNQFSVYSDTGIYFSKDYADPYVKLTNIKPSESFYISSANGVYTSETIGYIINMEDIIGGGVIFYVAVKTPEGAVFSPYETVLLSKSQSMTQITAAKMQDDFTVSKFSKILMKKLSGVKVLDTETPNGKWSKLKSIDTSDITIFKGSFTGKGKDEYLISFSKRVAFDAFASVTYVMNPDGKIIKTVFELTEKDFGYSKAIGICDVNGDGKFEILAEGGYYEGMSLSLWKLTDGEFIMIASGFSFGV